MKKLEILIATHKKYAFEVTSAPFCPIQIGAALSSTNLGFVRDDSGDNISAKNKNYCELTAIYWAWKNLDADYYGLMHYRRFLIIRDKWQWKFKHFLYYLGRNFKLRIIIRALRMHLLFQIATSNLSLAHEMVEETRQALPKLLEEFDVILPKKEFMEYTVYQQYKKVHFIKHLDMTLEIINSLYPKIYPYAKSEIHEKYAYCTNMFIMKKEYFQEYAKFMFDVLFELEKNIKAPTSKYQERVFGFISERLMAPFIKYLIEEKKVKIKELNILFVEVKDIKRIG